MDELEETKEKTSPSSNEARIETLVQSAFVNRITDPFMASVMMPDRPLIKKVLGHATTVVSETEDGKFYLDLASSNEQTLESIQSALEAGAPIKPWHLTMTEKRKLELAESELKKMQDVVARARAAADEALLYAQQYAQERSLTPAQLLAVSR